MDRGAGDIGTVGRVCRRARYRARPALVSRSGPHRICGAHLGGGDVAMNDPIPFPAPKTEHYTIDYDPVTHAVDIPLVPDEVMPAVCILAVLIDMLIEAGTLTGSEVLQVAQMAVGDI